MNEDSYINEVLTDILNNKYPEKRVEEILQPIDGIELIAYLKNCIEIRLWTHGG